MFCRQGATTQLKGFNKLLLGVEFESSHTLLKMQELKQKNIFLKKQIIVTATPDKKIQNIIKQTFFLQGSPLKLIFF